MWSQVQDILKSLQRLRQIALGPLGPKTRDSLPKRCNPINHKSKSEIEKVKPQGSLHQPGAKKICLSNPEVLKLIGPTVGHALISMAKKGTHKTSNKTLSPFRRLISEYR